MNSWRGFRQVKGHQHDVINRAVNLTRATLDALALESERGVGDDRGTIRRGHFEFDTGEAHRPGGRGARKPLP